MPAMANETIPEIQDNSGDLARVSPDNVRHFRELASAFKRTQLIEQDGGLLVKGVPMLASGTWTDSAIGTALNYPESTLREYAGNWLDNTGWSRHLGGVPRDVTDKVAELRNPRFENGAVTGDIFIHGATQKSRDLMELVKRKLISFVSVEHSGDERYNPGTRQLESVSINFTGFAFVNKGACKLCRINESQPDQTVKPVSEPEETKMTEGKELEAQIEAKDKEIEALKKELEALKTPAPVVEAPAPVEVAPIQAAAPEPSKELMALVGVVKELSERLTAMEKSVQPVTSTETKELSSEPAFYIHVDRKRGTVEG